MTVGADITGNRYGRLLVLRLVGKSPQKYLCVCDCGNEKVIVKQRLVEGISKSCGCLRTDMLVDRVKTHGLSKAPEHSVWLGMLQRCFNKNEEAYKDYGARGISVCDRWNPRTTGGFKNFYDDMGARPSGFTLDRIDVNGNYEPSNCRWVSNTEQLINRREYGKVKYKGVWMRENGKYRSRFQINGKVVFSKQGGDAKELAKEYDEAVFKNTGSWVGTNKALGLLDEVVEIDNQDILEVIEELQKRCHTASDEAGWWTNLDTMEDIEITKDLVGSKLMLVVTEIAEAMEGNRKDCMDDKLPHRKMIEVELADAIIRILDLAGAMNLNIGEAMLEKMAYNATREDHKIENRKKEGGKKV